MIFRIIVFQMIKETPVKIMILYFIIQYSNERNSNFIPLLEKKS